MFKTIQAAALASTLAVIAPFSASAVTIDFETRGDGTAFTPGNVLVPIKREYQQLGVIIRAFDVLNNESEAFVTNPSNRTFFAPSGDNILTSGAGLDGFIEITFLGQALLNGIPQTFAGRNILVPSVTDFVSINFADTERGGNALQAFDIAGRLIQQVLVQCAPGANCSDQGNLAPTQLVSIAAPGIAKIRLLYGGNGSGPDTLFDDLTFNTPSTVSRVPLPAGLPLLATALGLFGWLSTRRRTAA